MAAPSPTLCGDLFEPGQRIAVAVSGGADSVALMRRLLEVRHPLGIVLSVVHVDHGIRGAESAADAVFVRELAAAYDLPFYLYQADAPAAAAAGAESLEEAARNLRYAFFEKLIAEGMAVAVATGHTLDDQAETVLAKLLRGAWTEGLSGIHPVLAVGRGHILRPFLETTHAALQDWLRLIGQPWREDESNRDLTFTRNRIRHRLLPELAAFNPQIAQQLARLASIAADEEDYWQAEMSRLLPSVLLPGKPVRGGGRSSSTRPDVTASGIEIARLGQLHPAVRRRILRAAARRFGVRLSFGHTESLLALAGPSPGPGRRKLELPGGLVAERTPREVLLTRVSPYAEAPSPQAEYPFSIPGEVTAAEYGVRLRGEFAPSQSGASRVRIATLRAWKAGDRIILRHSRDPKRVKEVLDRLHVNGEERRRWPVVESEGKIVWMRGVPVNTPDFLFFETSIPHDESYK